MDGPPSNELLEANHTFPGVYKIKVIGSVEDNFEARVLDVVRAELASVSHLEHTVRSTPGGRHVSLTLDMNVETADQVRTIYARIRELKGLIFLL